MKILYYEEPRGRNLSSVHAYEVCSNLSKLGHNIVFVKAPPQKPGARLWDEIGTGLSAWKRIKDLLLLSWILERLRGELTLLWLFWCEASIFLSIFALILKNRDGLDVIYRRHNLLNSEYFLAKLFGIPSVKEVNGIVVDEMRIARKGDRVSLWTMHRIEKWNMPKAHRIIVVTSELKNLLYNDYRVSEDRVVVIENGANTDLFIPTDSEDARKELCLDPSDGFVCFVGGLLRWQGVEYLIQSAPLVMKECPSTKFIIVGYGAMREELVNLARETGISDKFIFTGFIPYENVPLYINASDVCVAPFVEERGERTGVSPLKLCEYMACEKPVVASAISGLEILESYNAGILVLPESPQELANAIIRLLQDPELRKKMGENGRKYVVENRSWESVAGKVAEVCEETANRYKAKLKRGQYLKCY